MNPNEIRSLHPSSAQLEALVEFMERNPGLAKGFVRTQNARERSRRQWEELAVRLNSIGGTIKTYKQWTKYWTDKKAAIKKKVAVRAAARRKTGGGVEEVVELTDLEERVVALCGGEGFSTGDANLGIQIFPENDTPPHQNADTDNVFEPIDYSQGNSQNVRLPVPAISFASSSSSNEQSIILQNIQPVQIASSNPLIYHPSMSPPPITLSHTPTPSPSRRGSTPVASPVYRRRTAAFSSSTHATGIASPSRRPRTNMTRASRGAGSVLSRHASSVVAPPPSQRRTLFSTITERFLRVEEQQLEIRRSNAQILQSLLEMSAERERVMDERSAERDRILAKAVAAVGKGLQALAEAINRDRV